MVGAEQTSVKQEAYMHNDLLKNGLKEFKIDFDDTSIERFEKYGSMIREWNQKINLTAITDQNEMAIKHFVDSATLLSAVQLKEKAKVIDIGTGAGFPGVPLKILRPDIDLTLLDGLNKRLIFLNEVMNTLGLNANIIHSRAEEGSRKAELREQFDLATSRAVAALNVLVEYCIPYVRVGGVFVAMKGPEVEEELKQAENAINILGGKIREIKKFSLPDNSRRSIIIIDKVRPISDKYPRHGSKISKKPL